MVYDYHPLVPSLNAAQLGPLHRPPYPYAFFGHRLNYCRVLAAPFPLFWGGQGAGSGVGEYKELAVEGQICFRGQSIARLRHAEGERDVLSDPWDLEQRACGPVKRFCRRRVLALLMSSNSRVGCFVFFIPLLSASCASVSYVLFMYLELYLFTTCLPI